jgi:hypothetical protein
MTGWARKFGTGCAALALVLAGARLELSFAQDSPEGYVIKVYDELVLTNVVARDAKTGELVRGLKQSDFSVYENGKQERISTFDFEAVEMATPLNEATVSGLATSASGNKAAVVAKPEDLRNHRLIVIFFDAA